MDPTPKPDAPDFTDTQLQQILELRRAGIGFARAAAQLGLADAEEARAAYLQALDDTDPRFDLALEIERIDRLHAVAWRKATGGDMAAMDRVIRLGERRERLTGSRRADKHEMREAFDESVAAAAAVDKRLDASIIAAGRAIADRIDGALCGDDPTETTKALYMVPHLVNILREMGATPKVRLEDAAAAAGGGEPKKGGSPSATAARRRRAAERAASAWQRQQA